ncbi:hypothetical protein TNCV_1288911 [Trichonephila clavipes]|nr:hypothetical protein TNCV_1288911 [Trichonephila clavipes]
MASAVLADFTCALQGTNQESGPRPMEESRKRQPEGNLEQLLLYADEHYLAEEFALGDHLGKDPTWVEENIINVTLARWSYTHHN